MRVTTWVAGLLRRRLLEVLGAAVGVALAVAFVVSLGSFVAGTRVALTVRAAASVPVDWQVQLTPRGDSGAVAAAVAQVPGLVAARDVRLAQVPGFESNTGGTIRRTGRGFVVSLPADYPNMFPAMLRYLVGAHSGVLLLQQTAANLGAAPGDTMSVLTEGGRAATVTVDGVVDMPSADSFFQIVGAPPGAGATAPPDNVLLVPPDRFAALTAGLPPIEQLHVTLEHATLPHDPSDAALEVDRRDKHLQVALAGGALVGDNLAAALSGAREDARYADLLFLLLGVPGIVLAGFVAALIVALRGDRRRREIALLRLRGASSAAVARIVGGEALLTAVLGAALGVAGGRAAIWLALPAGTALSPGWTLGGLCTGFALAVGVQLGPVVGTARIGAEAVAAGANRMPRIVGPWPLRVGLDLWCLAVAAVAFALTAGGGYQVVLAPEGVPQTQVDRAALLGPAFAWPGLALLTWRATAAVLRHRRGRYGDRPGRAPELEAASVRRRRWVIARGAAGLAVAIGLAGSTAVFTATYNTQSNIDVALTVGADVAIVEPPGAHATPADGQQYASAPGARQVEPLQHRFAYVGPDLQDLYGIRPATIGAVAPLRDAFVRATTIEQILAALARTPDGVLLSAETLHDYQLRPGDMIRLQLQTGPTGTYQPVPFHVIGEIDEFPTAPKDSFIVANADYLTQTSGSDAVAAFLIASSDPQHTADALRERLAGTGARVNDVVSARSTVTTATGLAATDLSGLSKLELGFGVLLALACSGLALTLGIAERRRALVLLAALGATSRQRGRFLAAEARALLAAGLTGGSVIAATLSYLLIKVLTGIFDPPPERPTLPWPYLAGLSASTIAATVLVVTIYGRIAARAGPTEFRDL